MKSADISAIRLLSQQIAATKFKSPKQIVSWMGAMQAQDFNMSKWAVGIRLRDSTEKEIERSINKGDIIRTHLLRPTWHFVAAEDIHWIMALTAPRIKSCCEICTSNIRTHRKNFFEKFFSNCECFGRK